MNKPALCKKILQILGWDTEISIPSIDKVVICLAPHTSNWDFIIGKLYYASIGLKSSFLIKDSWMRQPIKWWMQRHGAIGVDRSKSNSLTDQLAKKISESDNIHLAITPEGTRKRNPNWKIGFYYIAKKAGVPILPVALDFESKKAVVFDLFYPTDDEIADIKHIKSLYKDIKGLHPEHFTIGEELKI